MVRDVTPDRSADSAEYALVLPLPEVLSARIEGFREWHAGWARRPMRSWPHISIKGGAGLSADRRCLELIESVAARTAPFAVRLGDAAVFPGDGGVLHLRVDAPGWGRLHRRLVDSVAARTGARMHPLELDGWIPHVTLLRLTDAAMERREDVLAAARGVPAGDDSFVVRTLRMERFDTVADRWRSFRAFPLAGGRRSSGGTDRGVRLGRPWDGRA